MQRPSYEPFDPQQNHNAPAPFGNVSGVGGGYAHGQHNHQHFGQQNPPPAFASRFEVDQSVDHALLMLTNPDILNSLTSMVSQPIPQQQHLQQQQHQQQQQQQQQSQQQHVYNMPQQHHHHNSAYPPNPGPAGGIYAQRPNAPLYAPAHAMQGPGLSHDSRVQMFDGGSQAHVNRGMDAPPPHHMPHGMLPPGAAAITSRDAYPLDPRVGHLPQQRPGQYPQPSRPDYRQPAVDNRAREYRGMEGDSHVGHAAPLHNSRAEREMFPHAMAQLQGGREMGGGAGGQDGFGRRGAMDYRPGNPDANMGVHLEAFGGPMGAAQTAPFRGAAPGSFRPAEHERGPAAGNFNYREAPAADYRGGGDVRARDDGRLSRSGGSLLDAYSSGPSRNIDAPRYGVAAPAAFPSRNSLGSSRGGESLLDQYGGGGGVGIDVRGHNEGRGGGNRWDDRRSPSPSSRHRPAPARAPSRDAKFGLPGRARDPASSPYSSRFERRRSRSPIDRRVGSRGAGGWSPKDNRAAKGDEEVPPTKELFVGSIRDGTTEAHVLEAFSKFGPIDSLAVKANRHFGFVNFKNLSDAVRAKREMEGKPLATSIKLSIQFTKVDARRGGDDGRPERRIEREPIEKTEQQDSPASPEQLQHHSHASSSPSQERVESPVPEDVKEEGQEEQAAALDDAPSATGEHASAS